MASKNNSKNNADKTSETKGRKASAKSNANSDAVTIAELKKLLANANAENKKLSASYNALLKDNKSLKSSVKAVETERNNLKKQSDTYAKKDKQMQDKISKLQNDVLSSKGELSRIKKEKDGKLSADKQEVADKLKELKRKEKELERERSAIEKEVGILRKLKEDTKNSANSIAKSVSKMSYADSRNEPSEGDSSNLRSSKASHGESYPSEQVSGSNAPLSLDLDGLGQILNNFAATFKEAIEAIPGSNKTNDAVGTSAASGGGATGSINLDRIGEILEDFAVVLKDVMGSIKNAPISFDLDGFREILNDFAATFKDALPSQVGQTQPASQSSDSGSSSPSAPINMDGISKILEDFGVVLQEAIKSMPAAQVTAIPITQVTNTTDTSSRESAKMMESVSSYLEEAQKHISSTPPQVIISQQTVAPPKIEGLTAAQERDPSAMISKKQEIQETSSYSDMPIMRMKLDKDDDIYEERLVITYTFDNMPENRVYSKYKKILRNAVRITLLGNLQEGLELFNIIKNQNISAEYKSMIDKNIADITYYLRGKHRARLE